MHNISLMSDAERNALLKRAQTERICVSYQQSLSGELITHTSKRQKCATPASAVLALSALALASCTSSDKLPPTPSTQTEIMESDEVIMLGMMCPIEPISPESESDTGESL
ncbi:MULTISPECIES: hypothetical protein [unclassified Lentimonas]|uniref:hypothetical protein n=1 Tax=unclassified Lentimonas TaxID=2630993 RepID=UPI001389FB8C|nr:MULTISPECIES: hypothetical protein [unclassified Lentimonas]